VATLFWGKFKKINPKKRKRKEVFYCKISKEYKPLKLLGSNNPQSIQKDTFHFIFKIQNISLIAKIG
jgi:hypothetical protein